MAQLDDTARNLPQEGRVRRLKVLAVALRWNHAGTRANHFVEEEVVKDPITAYDHNIPLVDGHTVNGAAPLDDFIGDPVIEVRIDAVIYAAKLQGALGVAVDALHLSVEDYTKLPGAVILPEDKHFTVTYGENSDHGMQLAVDPGAVVQHSKCNGCGTHALSGSVSLLHQRDGPSVRPLQAPLAVWNQLCVCDALTSLQQLVRQLRGVDAKLLYLRDTVSHTEDHGRDHGSIGISVPRLCLLWMSLLVGAGTETEGLVLVVLLSQVFFPSLQVVQVLALARSAHEKGGRPAKRSFHHLQDPSPLRTAMT
mmetsp:Transcript_54297/g.126429  ORF Transcript_54297/g.126429 Transcript_54297/m.126429 type:complete len:309 (-) Transcript_54297:2-928(-)